MNRLNSELDDLIELKEKILKQKISTDSQLHILKSEIHEKELKIDQLEARCQDFAAQNDQNNIEKCRETDFYKLQIEQLQLKINELTVNGSSIVKQMVSRNTDLEFQINQLHLTYQKVIDDNSNNSFAFIREMQLKIDDIEVFTFFFNIFSF